MIGQRNEGIFAIIEGIIAGVGEKLGGAARAVGDALGGSGGGESSSLGGGLFSSLKESLFGGADAPAIAAPSREPSVAINTPAPSLDRFEVSMSELGTFAPPAVGMGAARGQGAGMNM